MFALERKINLSHYLRKDSSKQSYRLKVVQYISKNINNPQKVEATKDNTIPKTSLQIQQNPL